MKRGSPLPAGLVLGLLLPTLGCTGAGAPPAAEQPAPPDSPPAGQGKMPAVMAGPPPGVHPAAPEEPAVRPAQVAPAAGEAAHHGPPIRFTDITAASGITFHHHSGKSGQYYYVEPHNGGAALLDYDRDGKLDLYLVDGGPLPGCKDMRREGNKLYRGRGDGTFVDVTREAGVQGTGFGMGAYAADYDGDGDVDLYVTQLNVPNLLYRNEGNGRFTEVAGPAGVQGPGGWSSGATWLDADRDGDLDLFLVRYVDFSPEKNRKCYYKGHRYHCSPYDYKALSDRFFRNLGNGKFRDESKEAGIGEVASTGLGAIAGDLDGDGWPDVYVANDEMPNLLWRNKQDGTFEEIGLMAGVAVNPAGATQAGMGQDIGDVDGDDLQDVVCTNFQNEPNNLYMNKGDGRFVDEAAPRGWDSTSRDLLQFAVLLDDFDLDGDLDAFINSGHVWDNVAQIQPGVTYPQPKLLLVNDGTGHFVDGTARAGEALQRKEVSRAAVTGDIDGDGDGDIIYLNIDAPAVVLRNDTERAGNHWLNVRLRGRGRNTEGIGALVTVEAGGRRWQREMRSVRGFFSSSPAEIRFGLGQLDRVDRIRVRWPDGSGETEEPGGEVDRTVVITQPGG